MRPLAVVAILLAAASAAASASAAPRDCKKVGQAKRTAGRVAVLLATAKCHHDAKQYAAAWYEYAEAAARARDAKDKRSLKIAQKGEQQSAGLLAWITVTTHATDGVLEIDGEKTISGAKKAVDPGKHTIRASGGSRATPWSTTVELQSGDVEEILVPAAEGRAEPAASASAPEAPPLPSPSPTIAEPATSPDALPTAAAADRPAAAEAEPTEPEPHVGVAAGLDALVQLYDEVPAGEAERKSGQAFVFVATVAYDFNASLRAFVRYGLVDNHAPGRSHAAALSNPALGVSYGVTPLRGLRVAAESGLVVPLGSGGGDSPAAGIAGANVRGRALNPTLFDPNYLTPWVGAGAHVDRARVLAHLTVELDPSFRVRGGDENDAVKTRLQVAAHGGYRVIRAIEPFLEARYFRFLSSPAFVEADSSLRDSLFGGVGVAANFPPFSAQLAYLRALDPPLTRDSFSVVAIRVGVDF